MAQHFNQKGFDPIKAEYARLNCEAWIKANDILKEGRTRGKSDLPGADETQPDSIYQKIIDFVGQRARDCREDVISYVQRQCASMTDLTSDWENENPEITLEARIQKECGDLDSIAKRDLEFAGNKRGAKHQAEEALNEFKQENDLKRVAEYPDNEYAHWMWVPVAAIAESFIGANLLGSVSRGGTIEGWTVAAVLTIVNILFGIGAGQSCRFMNHARVLVKSINVLMLALVVVLALLWNTVAGHVRDAYVLAEASGNLDSIDSAFANAFAILVASPIPWDSLQSAGLVFVGIAVFMLTGYKSFTSDDRIPGYGKLHRHVEKLTAEYETVREECLDQLKTKHDEIHLVIEEFKDRHTADKASWQNIRDDVTTVLEEYEVNLSQYNLDLAYLLAAYRDANLAARTSPRPPFFNSPHAVDHEVTHRPEIEIPDPFQWGDIQHIAQQGFSKLEHEYAVLRNRFEAIDLDVEKEETNLL